MKRERIPKIIHYCWYGNKPIPKLHARFIDTWKKKMPEYEFKYWNESNSPMHLPYMQNAYSNKKWANLSNLTRLYALFNYGGIYLDTDIEVTKSFSPLLENACFLGFEDPYIDWDGCINNAVFGAEKGHWFVKEMYDRLLEHFDGTESAELSSPNLTTYLLKERGLSNYKRQDIDDISIFPTEYFYPYSWHEIFNPDKITVNTFCIHHFAKSWSDKPNSVRFTLRLKQFYHNLRWKIKKRWG